MRELRETMGRGILLVAATGLLLAVPACGAPEEITYVPPDDTVDGSDPGANSLVDDDGAYLRQLDVPSREADEGGDGQR